MRRTVVTGAKPRRSPFGTAVSLLAALSLVWAGATRGADKKRSRAEERRDLATIVKASRMVWTERTAQEARRTLEGLSKAYPKNHQIQWDIKVWIGLSYKYNDPAKGIAILREVRQKATNPETLAEAVAFEALLTKEQGDVQAARNLLEKCLLDPKPVRWSAGWVPQTYWKVCGDCPERGAKVLRQFVSKRKPCVSLHGHVLTYVARLLLSCNREAEAASAFIEALQRLAQGRAKGCHTFALGLQALQKSGRLGEFKDAARLYLAGLASGGNLAQVRSDIVYWVNYCVDVGELAEALWVTRLSLGVCYGDSTTFQGLIGRFAAVCRRKRLPLADINDYQLYLALGPSGEDGKLGTDDDPPSPWKAFKVSLPQPMASSKLIEGLLKACPDHCVGRRRAGYVHLLTSAPRTALKAFLRAYDQAGIDEEKVTTAIQDICAALTAYAGHAGLATRYLDYQRLGRRGPDRKRGTADDLTDPVGEILAKPDKSAATQGARSKPTGRK